MAMAFITEVKVRPFAGWQFLAQHGLQSAQAEYLDAIIGGPSTYRSVEVRRFAGYRGLLGRSTITVIRLDGARVVYRTRVAR